MLPPYVIFKGKNAPKSIYVLYMFYLNFASSHNKVSETLNATTE